MNLVLGQQFSGVNKGIVRHYSDFFLACGIWGIGKKKKSKVGTYVEKLLVTWVVRDSVGLGVVFTTRISW